MVKLSQNLTPETAEKIYSQWIEIIKRRESGSIIHLPKRDQLYRAHAFLQSENLFKKYFEKKTDLQLILLDLAAEPIEDSAELLRFIKSEIQSKIRHAALLILDADKLIDEKPSLLASLNNLYHQFPTISLLYFFRRNITYPQLSKKLSSCTTLYQNICIFSHLEKADSYHFIHYLEKKFSITFPQDLIHEIAQKCGGIVWIIKEACRQFCKTKDAKNLFSHGEMQVKLGILWQEFELWEKKILEKIIKKESHFSLEEKSVIKYLLQTNTIYKKNNNYCFSAPILEDFVRKQAARKLTIELIDGQRIAVNGVVMNNYFSKREKRLLILLIDNKEKIIPREQAAKTVWGDNYHQFYTDWALDQFIRRLRIKLSSLGFEGNFIKTIKNHGFSLTSYVA